MPKDDRDDEAERKARTPYDLARFRLNNLQKHPERLAPIPQKRDTAPKKAPPEFVRNVPGSTAAAGSSEFHIYRNNRRKEMTRLDDMEKDYQEQKLDEEYKQRVEERKIAEDKKQEKNRLKRQRKKEREKELKAQQKEAKKAKKAEEQTGKSEHEHEQGSNGDTDKSSDVSDDEKVKKSNSDDE